MAVKRHMKLPNGYGSIKRLSGKRRKPFAAYPPVKEFKPNGSPKSVPAIGYYETYMNAMEALLEYNKNPRDLKKEKLTFAQVYDLFFEAKYVNGMKKMSKSTQQITKSAYRHCSNLYDLPFCEINAIDLQNTIDACELKHSTHEIIKYLFNQMYHFAILSQITKDDWSKYVIINKPDDDEKGEPFSERELEILWNNTENEYVQSIIVVIYSGYRISAYYKEMEINLEEKYFKGGVKTAASKERIVPFHEELIPLIRQCYDRYNGRIYKNSPGRFRKIFEDTLNDLGILTTESGKKHTPHDCRHTFSWLCDKYYVDDKSKHMLMGHSIGNDVEAQKYTHRTVDQLREEINKIEIPFCH